jgi:hypothetical protein
MEFRRRPCRLWTISLGVSNIHPSYREFALLTLHADLFRRIAELACDLCKKLKKATLQAHDIQTAYVSSSLSLCLRSGLSLRSNMLILQSTVQSLSLLASLLSMLRVKAARLSVPSTTTLSRVCVKAPFFNHHTPSTHFRYDDNAQALRT